MSSTLRSENFGDKLYNSLPEIYRTVDIENDYALKRYLNALGDGGFMPLIDDMNRLLEYTDPNRIPDEALKVAFRNYGLEVFESLSDTYLRRLYPLLQTLYVSKGTGDVLEYISSILADTKTIIEVSPKFEEDYSINLKLEMDYNMMEGQSHDIPSREDMKRLIDEFVPFFVDVTIIYVYVFYENQKLNALDTLTENKIKQMIKEVATFPIYEDSDELLRSKVKTKYEDVINIENSIKLLDNIKTKLVDESALVSPVELTGSFYDIQLRELNHEEPTLTSTYSEKEKLKIGGEDENTNLKMVEDIIYNFKIILKQMMEVASLELFDIDMPTNISTSSVLESDSLIRKGNTGEENSIFGFGGLFDYMIFDSDKQADETETDYFEDKVNYL